MSEGQPRASWIAGDVAQVIVDEGEEIVVRLAVAGAMPLKQRGNLAGPIVRLHRHPRCTGLSAAAGPATEAAEDDTASPGPGQAWDGPPARRVRVLAAHFTNAGRAVYSSTSTSVAVPARSFHFSNS